MKGKTMLAALLALLTLGGSTAGILYKNGYWDTWTDKKNAYMVELQEEMGNQVPPEAKIPLAECIASQLLSMCEQSECELKDGPVSPQVIACLKPTRGQEASMVILSCVSAVQSQLSEGSGNK